MTSEQLEPPPGYVITWWTQFSPFGRWYQYAAVHVAGKGWYTTDTKQREPWPWCEVLRRIGSGPYYVLTPMRGPQ